MELSDLEEKMEALVRKRRPLRKLFQKLDEDLLKLIDLEAVHGLCGEGPFTVNLPNLEFVLQGRS